MGQDTPENASDKKKVHRERKSGHKAEQKKRAKAKDGLPTDKQKNPKAFGFNSAVKAERRFRRAQDITTKRQHIPEVDRTPLEPPPILIGIVGPKGVGKTTLMNSLIKMYTKAPVTSIKGPVTIVIGKKKRVTLIECNNDINSMIDIAKVADIVLLLSDAYYKFEMAMFEFISICKVHGMPRIMGVLTHLDLIKNPNTLKKVKKELKHRMWTEIFRGAKLFYLTGMLNNKYLNNEIKNLSLYITVMKLRPVEWRSTHSYMLADRYEDLTNQELIRKNEKCDRNIVLYGYIRGIPLNKTSFVHLAGLGDLQIQDVSFLPDPCPLPDAIKKRSLNEKEKLVYAPFSGVGGIVYDKDAVYVELGGSHSYKERDEETDQIIKNIMNTDETLAEKVDKMEFKIFSDGKTFTSKDLDNLVPNIPEEPVSGSSVEDGRRKLFAKLSRENVDEGDEEDNDSEEDEYDEHDGSDSNEEENGSDGEENDENGPDEEENDENLQIKWKDNLVNKAHLAFLNRQSEQKNLMKYVYGVFNQKNTVQDDDNKSEEQEEIGGLFTVISYEEKKKKADKAGMNADVFALFEPWNSEEADWLDFENKALIANCFVTGKWKDSEDASELLKLDDAEISDDSEVYGDFEDLETGEKHSAVDKEDDDKKGGSKKRKRNDESDEDEKSAKKKLSKKKRKLREKFNTEYDNIGNEYYDGLKSVVEQQSQLNKTVFENMEDDIRVQLEGYRPGMYCRLEFKDVPCEFVHNFDPTYPLLVGALNRGEENIGYVTGQITKHRWFNRTLKTNDPLIISLGWRRFQTVPIYSKLEDDLKYRYLKYTPDHASVKCHFWGPITPQKTGFLALQSCDENSWRAKEGFRIVANGIVHDLDKTTQIMKKLKLIGEPLKIYKKTAFIKDMFTSSLEVAKFEGARVQTVSGIRGQIKKAINKPEGSFRATFEDTIKLSDIVFCKTWVNVDVAQFYNPVCTLLLPHDQKDSWKGLRTKGEIKFDEGVKNEPNKDSLYRPIKRIEKPFKPFHIPKELQEALPYKNKPKLMERKDKQEARVAVIREPEEQKIATMMKMFRTAYAHKTKQKRIASEAQRKEFIKEKQREKELKVKKAQAKRRQKKSKL